ncbi:hypothetical protein FZ103_20280 [Streptomonospora sp. PA3]|nr:hypothetical protein [Streptomonospora sp. PA3]
MIAPAREHAAALLSSDALHGRRGRWAPGQARSRHGIVEDMIAALDPMLCVRRHVDFLRVRSAICRNVG